MRRLLLTLYCILHGSAFAQGTMQTVVPFGFENQSGNGASGYKLCLAKTSFYSAAFPAASGWYSRLEIR